MDLTESFWSSFFSAVAAVAALGAVTIASITVRQEKRAREDFNAAHDDQTKQRRQALEVELRLRQLEQVEQVCEVLANIADAAVREATHRPHREAPSGPRPTVMEALQSRLGAAEASLRALGVHDLDGVHALAQGGFSRNASDTVRHVSNCMDQIRHLLPSFEDSSDLGSRRPRWWPG